MKRKRTEITIESSRMLYISSPRMVFTWCATCGAQVEMLPVDEAAILRRVNSRTVFSWVEARQVHSRESANGLLLICLNSLSLNNQLVNLRRRSEMNEKFSYQRIMAGCAVAALMLAQSAFGFSTLRSGKAGIATDLPDLTNELRTIDSFANDLVTYKKACAALNKRPSLLNTDIDPVQRSADDLKRRISEVQNVIRDIVRKLKAANQWDDLDSIVVTRLTQPAVKSQFQQESLKSLLENAASTLASRSNELNEPVEGLRKRIARTHVAPHRGEAWFVNASFTSAAPVKFEGVDCLVQRVRVGLVARLGRNTDKAVGDMSCACGGTMNIMTGEPCD